MSLAIRQILSQDRQAKSRAYKKPFSSSAQNVVEEAEAVDDQHVDYHLTLQCLANTRSINQYLRNANDGISIVQIVADALTQTDTALDEIRQLADWQRTDTPFDPSKMIYWLKQVQTVSQETRFNHQYLLDGTFKPERYIFGGETEQSVKVYLSSSSPAALGFGQDINEVARRWQAPGGPQMPAVSRQEKVAVIDNAQQSVADIRASLSPLHERFAKAIGDLSALVDNTQKARNRIHDPDVATKVTALTKKTLLTKSKISLQVQANQQPKIALQLLE
jgi:flagellin